jgi:hypothetical protein
MLSRIGQRCFLGILFAGTSLLFADTVTVPGQNPNLIWQNWTTAQLNDSGTPFWNHASFDGTRKNIGDCLTSAAPCGITNPPGAIPYLGTSTGAAFPEFYFNSTGGSVTATLAGGITASSNDIFGWYNISNPSQLNVIFAGGAAVGQTVTFTPSAQYGLFLRNATPGFLNTYLSQSDLAASSDPTNQHLAAFQQSAGVYYIGSEDFSVGSDLDYNDVIVRLSSTIANPEPVSILLVGSGLVGFGFAGYRRRRSAIKARK